MGIISGFHPADGIAGDLGGGSLELVDVRGETIGDGITLPLGGLRLEDMSRSSLIEAARSPSARSDAPSCSKGGEGRAFYCVGGTWRNLARLHMSAVNYPLTVMHDYEFDVDSAAPFLRQVARGDIDGIRGNERVSKNRRTLLPLGATVLNEIVCGDAPVQDRGVGSRGAGRLPLRAVVPGGARGRSIDLGGRGACPAARRS